MKPRNVLTLAALALVLAEGRAAAAPADERVALERATRLDLGREWSAYTTGDQGSSFRGFVDRRWRIRRDVGRGLVVASATLFVVGSFMVSFGVSMTDEAGRSRLQVGLGCYGATAGLAVAGGALWGAYFRRLERLPDDDLAFGTSRRLRLRSLGPLMLPQGGGFAVRLAF